MSTELKINYVGKVELLVDGSVIKTYQQNVAGSVWKKFAADLLLIHRDGHTKIIMQINEFHPNKSIMIDLAKDLQSLIPGLVVKEIIGI